MTHMEVTSQKYIEFEFLTLESLTADREQLSQYGERNVYIYEMRKIKLSGRYTYNDLLWCADSKGYTKDVDKAGKYKLKDAFSIMSGLSSSRENIRFLFCDI